MDKEFSREDIQMTNEHMPRCLTSRETPIKNTVRYHLAHIRMLLLKEQKLSVGKEVALCTVGMQGVAATAENCMEVPPDPEMELPYDLLILLLGIYRRDSKQDLEEILAHPRSLKHYAQQPRSGNKLTAHQHVNG